MSPPLSSLFQRVCKAVNPSRGGAASDAHLLDQFVRHKDESAFELLVWRHGPLVLSVCRRVLHDPHAAEDAFQATFLTLVRKAGSIGKRTALSSWLYKVAYRIALRARARQSRHAACEQPLSSLPDAQTGNEPPDLAAWRELRRVLDVEVHRLPEKYRAPLVLCYLEGKTNEQAAEELGCPKGTVLSRLARARERLRGRLARRGLALSALPLAALVAEHTEALLKMSPVLVNGTIHMSLLVLMGNLAKAAEKSAAAVELMQAATAEMGRRSLKAKLVAAAAVAVLLMAGAGLWAFHARTTGSHPQAAGTTPQVSLPNPTAAVPAGGCCGEAPVGGCNQ
ncbi:MAG TPA: sigma-70 family RNA polymerase sigma factor [Gemmataceae bacterium]|nr:sigma-70 family RNA polymerase sigma factor [Gemmataceae bacterium]